MWENYIAFLRSSHVRLKDVEDDFHHLKSHVSNCWVCVIFFACVCVGASDTTTASDGPYKLGLCRCAGRFLGGSQGGAGMPPPGYAQRSAPGGSPGPTGFGAAPRKRFFFLGGFCYF
jgi:hypothetical protein